eukprot:SAG11_NODE_6698_length_1264_cov_1.854077_1_plen_51_part_00
MHEIATELVNLQRKIQAADLETLYKTSGSMMVRKFALFYRELFDTMSLDS